MGLPAPPAPVQALAAEIDRRVDSLGLPSLIGFGIASTQVTLLFRAEHVGAAIAAVLVWMAGAVLMGDWQEQRCEAARRAVQGPRAWLALAALAWCLLVLSFAARFYDLLLYPIPLVCFVAIALLEGAKLRSRTVRDLLLIGCLLPLHQRLAATIPTDGIVVQTAKLACIGLWGLGRECVANGNRMKLASLALEVDPPCAGVETLVLALSSCLVFLVLFPMRRHWFHAAALIGSSLLIAFVLNAFRVLILALSSPSCDRHWWSQYCGFDFWHLGTGSQLFPLLAVSAVCWLWWWDIQREGSPETHSSPPSSPP